MTSLTIANSTVTPFGGIDFAFWGFILGAIGTVGTILSSLLVVLQIRQMRRTKAETKTEQREDVAQTVLQGILGPIRYMADSTADTYPNGIVNLVDYLRLNRDTILGSEPVLRKTTAQIASNLLELIHLIDAATFGRFEIVTSGYLSAIQNNQKFKPLVSTLHKDIEKWLLDHT